MTTSATDPAIASASPIANRREMRSPRNTNAAAVTKIGAPFESSVASATVVSAIAACQQTMSTANISPANVRSSMSRRGSAEEGGARFGSGSITATIGSAIARRQKPEAMAETSASRMRMGETPMAVPASISAKKARRSSDGPCVVYGV